MSLAMGATRSGSALSARASIASAMLRRSPRETLIVDREGEWTVAAMAKLAERVAAGLQARGVGAGDRVAALQELSVAALATWWGANRLGAVYMPINPLWPGALTSEVLRIRQPALVVHDAEIKLPNAATTRFANTTYRALLDGKGTSSGLATGDFEADAVIVHNSGLPGIRRGVRASSVALSTMATGMQRCYPEEARVLLTTGLCYMGTLLAAYGSVLRGGSVALLPGLRADGFWPAIDRFGVTAASLVSPSLDDLLRAPPAASDRYHSLELVAAPPGTRLGWAARERFGVHWVAGLAKTEACGAVSTDLDPDPEHGAGWCLPPFEARVVDAVGHEVEIGEVGELALRASSPWELPAGYADPPGQGVALWRDGWLHTGWRVKMGGDRRVIPEAQLSMYPLVARKDGYMFIEDVETEALRSVTGTYATYAAELPGPEGNELVLFLAGTAKVRAKIAMQLRSAIPEYGLPDRVVSCTELPPRTGLLEIPRDAWSLDEFLGRLS